MKKIDEEPNKIVNFALWLIVAVVTAGAFLCTYKYNFSGPIQAFLWLGWFVLVVALSFLTTIGKRIYNFAQEAKIELLKVVWPTRQETVQTTAIVMIMVSVAGFVLWAVDSIMMWAIARLTHLG